MRKILALLSAIIMMVCSLSFVACGGSNDVDVPEDKYSGATFDQKTGELFVSSKENKTPIKITYSVGNGHEWIRKQAGMFLASEYGANYYCVLTPDDSATESISSKLENGNSATLDDLYLLLASPWQSYAALDQLENLDDLYDSVVPGEEIKVIDKITGSWKNYGIGVNHGERHNYVFPCTTAVTGLVYNKTLFDEYGWTVPTTFEELTALCEKIVADTNGSIKPFIYPGTVNGGYWDFVGQNWWLQVSGKDKLDEFMKFESAEVFNADSKSSPSYGKLTMLEEFQNLVVKNKNKYIANRSASYDNTQAQQGFGARMAAMMPNGSWLINESGQDITDEIRMMPTPFMKDALKDENGKYISYNYSGQPDFYIVPKKATNKEGAKKLLAFMCRDDALINYTSTTGTARPFVYDTDQCTNLDGFAQSCLEIFKNSTTWFEESQSPLWTGLRLRKYNSPNPYTQLISQYPSITADSWCASEYAGVKADWNNINKAVI